MAKTPAFCRSSPPAFGVGVSAVGGLGIKVAWTEEELARARALAARPNPVYATRGEAAKRHLRLAGLSGLVAPDAVADAALVPGDEGWSVAFDPAAFAVGAPDMAGLLGAGFRGARRWRARPHVRGGSTARACTRSRDAPRARAQRPRGGP
jgi:hypothetical protein